MNKPLNKPELLLPAGNVESFYAAIEAGADAIYLGSKHFNARERAANFSPPQLKAMVKYAHSKHVKIYITLNTVIKNAEIPELIDVLYQFQQIKPDALIIQDMAVWHIVSKYFPELTLHASTQMAHHNSFGAAFTKQIGIERVIMARELTLPELQLIMKHKTTEIEIFVHGALCYSFSGMCLFTSYLGGMGANRGLCKQACRRVYDGDEKGFHFSMKDNQLIELIPEFIKMGVSSLKIEGRMKPAEYVYKVGRAYRMAIDNPEKINEAKEILKLDLGREKTSWFMGGKVSDSITQAPATGIFLGKVQSCNQNDFTFQSNISLNKGSRLRLFSAGISEHSTFKVEQIECNNGLCKVTKPKHSAQVGDDVFLAGVPEKNFSSKIQSSLPQIKTNMPYPAKQKILRDLELKTNKPKNKDEIFIRINELAWLPKIDLRNTDAILLNLPSRDWEDFDPQSNLIQKFRDKFIIELPKFIPEKKIGFYQKLCKNFMENGLKKFSLSHLSQKRFIPKGSWLMANENVYSFSDAAIIALKRNGMQSYVRPLENDYPNLLKGNDRQGIIPIYYHPHLFVSRMPVKTGDTFSEKKGVEYLRFTQDGITYVIPEIPVSLTQYTNKLRNKGFRRFLIDLSFTKVSSNRIKTIQKRLQQSEQIQPSNNFNFKAEMK